MASRITRTGVVMPFSDDGDAAHPILGLLTDDDVEYELQFDPDSELADFVDERVKVSGTLMSGPYGTHVIRVGHFELDEDPFDDDEDFEDFDEDYDFDDFDED